VELELEWNWSWNWSCQKFSSMDWIGARAPAGRRFGQKAGRMQNCTCKSIRCSEWNDDIVGMKSPVGLSGLFAISRLRLPLEGVSGTPHLTLTVGPVFFLESALQDAKPPASR
jgi:hypothetical protein